jgi:hypothetical protein
VPVDGCPGTAARAGANIRVGGIANVALPYMQGSFSSSFDEITWVLTSYITA